MNASRYSTLVLLGLAMGISACSAAHRSNDVWDSYDIRHPAPVATPAPDTYIDNDSYYAAPDCSIFDAPSCGSD